MTRKRARPWEGAVDERLMRCEEVRCSLRFLDVLCLSGRCLKFAFWTPNLGPYSSALPSKYVLVRTQNTHLCEYHIPRS